MSEKMSDEDFETKLHEMAVEGLGRDPAFAARVRELQSERAALKDTLDYEHFVKREADLAQLRSDLAAARAELERWRDPESAERLALQEDVIFSIGEGNRSEIELRESQLAQAEAALALARDEIAELRRDLLAATEDRP